MAMGRPREHDREQIAIDLITWAQKEDSTNLNGFCGEQLIAPSKITEWARECKDFRSAYEKAKALLAWRRERGLSEGTLHVKAYDLNASVYDHFLKLDKREQLEYEKSLEDKVQEKVDPDTINNMKEFFKVAKSMRSNKDE